MNMAWSEVNIGPSVPVKSVGLRKRSYRLAAAQSFSDLLTLVAGCRYRWEGRVSHERNFLSQPGRRGQRGVSVRSSVSP